MIESFVDGNVISQKKNSCMDGVCILECLLNSQILTIFVVFLTNSNNGVPVSTKQKIGIFEKKQCEKDEIEIENLKFENKRKWG